MVISHIPTIFEIKKYMIYLIAWLICGLITEVNAIHSEVKEKGSYVFTISDLIILVGVLALWPMVVILQKFKVSFSTELFSFKSDGDSE